MVHMNLQYMLCEIQREVLEEFRYTMCIFYSRICTL